MDNQIIEIVDKIERAVENNDFEEVSKLKKQLNELKEEAKKPINLFKDDPTLAVGPLYETPPKKHEGPRQYRPEFKPLKTRCCRCGTEEEIPPQLMQNNKYTCNKCASQPTS